MGLLDSLRRLFTRPAAELREELPSEPGRSEQAAAWLAALESGELDVPQDVHDGEAWDRYWFAHIKAGPFEQGFGDMMADDPELVPELDRRQARSVLCVGIGFSSEAWALAMYGFEVTCLDISSFPRGHLRSLIEDPEGGLRGQPGVVVLGEASIAYDAEARPASDELPAMHKAEGRAPRGGGSLTHVTGDLIDPGLCPGPFDVVIERRTVQLFPDDERPVALDRLAARLGPDGLLVSHQHYGTWKPEEPTTHFAAQWATDSGFTLQRFGHPNAPGRAARLVFTTG